jgi:hypothetical protein
MSAAKGFAPQGDPLVIDAAEATCEVDGRAVVCALSGDVDQPAWFTLAGTQVAAKRVAKSGRAALRIPPMP